jgi:hypothetical protein
MFAVVRVYKYLLSPLHQKRNSWLPSWQTMCPAIKAVLGDRNEAPKTPNSEFYSPFPDSSPAPEREMGGWACCKFFARQGLQRKMPFLRRGDRRLAPVYCIVHAVVAIFLGMLTKRGKRGLNFFTVSRASCIWQNENGFCEAGPNSKYWFHRLNGPFPIC